MIDFESLFPAKIIKIMMMKKTTITTAMIELISNGYPKAEIFARLIQQYGLQYHNLISQVIHFEYDYLRKKYDPEMVIRREISELLQSHKTKAEIYQHLYEKHGNQADSLIATTLEKDYDTLKGEQKEVQKVFESADKIDYTLFFNLDEKLKVTNKERFDYQLQKEFIVNQRALIGEVEIKHGKLFIGTYSFEENLVLTFFNFITVLNSIFKDYFVLTLSHILSVELLKKLNCTQSLEFESIIHIKDISQTCCKPSTSTDQQDQYLLDVFYSVDSEMLSMTVIAKKP